MSIPGGRARGSEVKLVALEPMDRMLRGLSWVRGRTDTPTECSGEDRADRDQADQGPGRVGERRGEGVRHVARSQTVRPTVRPIPDFKPN
jgi:hypothetical protein